jgi:hypothetical protein
MNDELLERIASALELLAGGICTHGGEFNSIQTSMRTIAESLERIADALEAKAD